MEERSLAQTNPFLIDPLKRAEAVAQSIKTSSAIEGIKVDILVKNQNGKISFIVKSQLSV